jgi:hypothetical protein
MRMLLLGITLIVFIGGLGVSENGWEREIERERERELGTRTHTERERGRVR